MKVILLRNSLYLLASVAVVVAVMAGYKLFTSAESPGKLVADRTVTDFGALPLGEHRIAVTHVSNRGGRPACILGVSASCGQGVCYEPIGHLPASVPPGGTVDVVCLMTLREEGPVGFQVRVYLDNGNFDCVDVRVRGTAASRSPGPRW